MITTPRRFPRKYIHLVSKSVRHYFDAGEDVQRMVLMTHWMKGRWGNLVFQTSHGVQQIKLYEPEKYKNDVNTPLRTRARMLFKMANEEPYPNFQEKLQYLMRTEPFILNQDLPINLRLLNFYFDRDITPKSAIKIYKLRKSDGPANPDPVLDELYWEGEYSRKKTVSFEYSDDKDDYYYAILIKNEAMSNLLHFIWKNLETKRDIKVK